ncbi:cytochrome c biogenesis protein CcsA [Candidatus Methanoperedens nitratireducens]|uniref:Putative Cytochrome c-type biogenesis protein n=1 Tax=Candidatus Methanoperedens nitratireducens TaxID=1392998 RepID=A0A284VL37_9EURY|nr:cytochrome c biogenesis protein CcsA [Candidatus Methanoperedens nitroreducens]SNQ59990.1 putative Cytochrome c-type biogenesis protein [Candidatus Methanoperedens nitroreducens]
MVNLGNALLYASIVASAVALAGLLLKELKNNNLLSRLVSPMILVSAGLLAFAYVLITYYFVIGDYTYEYVWQYSSLDLPLIYKISGAWAGQPGTYLLWVLVIFLSSAWLALTTKHISPLARRTQIITVIIGIYFTVLTLIQTPFKTIYEGRPDLLGYVPADGSGLNTLLVNFWMIVHPPLMFIGYAAMTIPFAAAIVYLITKEDGWEELSRQWARFTWLFLGMGIAVGGVWAYMVLGWGGFWAWDPVETASFIPWLTLTGYLHATALHRKNKRTFSIAAPILAAVSFILVVYAAIVVRSGLFNSVHAFGEASTGTLLIMSLLVTTLVSVALGMRRYFEEPQTPEEDPGFWSKTNLFFVTLLLFVILAFVSFWGITYPVFIQLTQGLKVNVASDTKNFFNVWSYPFTIVLLLALGFCLNYKESNKEQQKQTLFIVAALSVIFMLPRTENFYVLNHSSPFWVREPAIYKLIGNISVLSIFPSLLYATYSIISYLRGYLQAANQRVRIKGIGITMVHIAVILTLFGAIVSSTLDNKIEGINIPLEAKGQMLDISNGYSVKILDYSTRSLTGNSDSNSGIRISEVLADPSSYENNSVKISGKVTNLRSLEGHGTLVELVDNSGSIRVVIPGNYTESTLPRDTPLTVTGTVMAGFQQPILSATDVTEGESTSSDKYRVQSVQLEVYQNNKKIGSGTAEYLEGKGGSGTFPMVESSITGTDVYVIFQGMSSGFIPLTMQIKPAINFAWVGIILFAVGIILIMAVKTKSKGDSKGD